MSLDLTGFDNEQALREGGHNPPEPGIYHLAVSAVDTAPVSKAGEAMDAIQVTFQVLAGTVEGMEGREFRQMLFAPSPTSKDGGRFATQRLAMIGLCTEVIDPSQCGSNVDPNWEDMIARHFVAEVELRDKYTEIKGLNMWHVNDAAAAKFPKDAEVLQEMPMTRQPATPASPPAAASTKAGPKPGAPRPGAAAKAVAKPAAKPAPVAPASNAAGSAAAPAAAAADPYGDL